MSEGEQPRVPEVPVASAQRVPKAPTHRPWHPVPMELREVAAIQNLANGEATPDQQRYALKWIVEAVCGTYDETYFPGGEDGRRDTDFAAGRRFVGNTLVKATRLSRSALAGEPTEQG